MSKKQARNIQPAKQWDYSSGGRFGEVPTL